MYYLVIHFFRTMMDSFESQKKYWQSHSNALNSFQQSFQSIRQDQQRELESWNDQLRRLNALNRQIDRMLEKSNKCSNEIDSDTRFDNISMQQDCGGFESYPIKERLNRSSIGKSNPIMSSFKMIGKQLSQSLKIKLDRFLQINFMGYDITDFVLLSTLMFLLINRNRNKWKYVILATISWSEWIRIIRSLIVKVGFTKIIINLVTLLLAAIQNGFRCNQIILKLPVNCVFATLCFR